MNSLVLGLLVACTSVLAAPAPYPGPQPGPAARPGPRPSPPFGGSVSGPSPAAQPTYCPPIYEGYGNLCSGCGCGLDLPYPDYGAAWKTTPQYRCAEEVVVTDLPYFYPRY